MVSRLSLALAFVSTLSALAHPVAHHSPDEIHVIGTTQSSVLNLKRQEEPAPASDSVFKVLATGNDVFRKEDPALLKKLTDEGQAPPFMFLGCSDSRVNEGTVFNAQPGTFFTQRNIANQVQATDHNTESVIAYGVSVLGVQHIIVMGHYGCGGVAAAIATPPTEDIDAANGVVQNWILPIRQIFESSTRPEIVEFREKNKNVTLEEPEVGEPAFRALVEENIKSSVSKIAGGNVIKNHYARLGKEAATPAKRASHHESGPPKDVFIHGWVYDIENGEVKDLGISVGPPNKAIPPPPFPLLSQAIAQTTGAHAGETVQKRCEGQCQSKRSLFSRHHD